MNQCRGFYSMISLARFGVRAYCTAAKRGLILGVYQNDKQHVLTSAAKKYDQQNNGKISKLVSFLGDSLSPGNSQILYTPENSYGAVALVGLGAADVADTEGKDERKDAVRCAVAAGAARLRDAGCDSLDVDDCGDASSAAEGATLCLFTDDFLRSPNNRQKAISIAPHSESFRSEWNRGIKYAEGQNLARKLTGSPANHLTPMLLAKEAVENLEPLGVKVMVRDADWCKDQHMNAFLSVSGGSVKPPTFIHASYIPKGTENNKPLCFVGKGITFDSGGISLKKAEGMHLMKADMGGAAAAIGALQAIAALQLPINVQVFVPACENMPGNDPNRPGDVVQAMNGKSIEVVDTDYEGRLILADALCYAHKVTDPSLIISLATLTLEVIYGLGASASAAYTTSDAAWQRLERAGHFTGDRVWRMPLWKQFSDEVKATTQADLANYAKYLIYGHQVAGSCNAAAFLKEFVSTPEWIHLDIAGMLINNGSVPYLCQGMTGRPTRTLTRLAEMMI